jgi:hypothetical protein
MVRFLGKGTFTEPIVILDAKSDMEAVRSEYQYIKKLHGNDWKKVSQSVMFKGDGLLDEIVITLKNGEKLTFYFNIP